MSCDTSKLYRFGGNSRQPGDIVGSNENNKPTPGFAPGAGLQRWVLPAEIAGGVAVVLSVIYLALQELQTTNESVASCGRRISAAISLYGYRRVGLFLKVAIFGNSV